MISGTYVLTDSIDQAFDRIFTDIRQGSNAVISGKSAVDLSDQDGLSPPTLDDSLLPQVRALPGVAEAEGSVDSDATQLIGDDGKAVVSGGAPEPRLLDRQRRLGVQPADAGRRRRGPVRTRSSSTRRPPASRTSTVGEKIGVQAEGPVERDARLGHRPVQLGPHDRRRDARRVRPPDGAASLQEGRPAGRDRRRREARTSPDARARRRDRGDPPTDGTGADGERAGARRRSGHERVHLVPPHVPARVRRDRALRRLVRHRELALDHDRPAHARVRDPANHRCDEPPGPRLRHRRSARRRSRRLDRRPLPRAAAREGPLQAVRRRRLHAAELRARVRAACGRDRAAVGILVTLLASIYPGYPRDHGAARSLPSARERFCRASRSTASGAHCAAPSSRPSVSSSACLRSRRRRSTRS